MWRKGRNYFVLAEKRMLRLEITENMIWDGAGAVK
jgi:hypothetical protein